MSTFRKICWQIFSSKPMVLSVLRDYDSEQFYSQVTERIVRRVCGWSSTDAVKLLLQNQNPHLITEAVVRSAVENDSHGQAIMEVLVEATGGRLPVTEEIVLAAYDNYHQSDGILNIIHGLESLNVKQGSVDVASIYAENKPGRAPRLPESVVGEAIHEGTKALKTLLQQNSRRIGDVHHTTSNAMLTQHHPYKVIITKGILNLGASEWSRDPEIMQILLENWDREAWIPEAVLKTAVQNRYCGFSRRQCKTKIADVLNIILNMPGVQADITDNVLFNAAKHGTVAILQLLLDRQIGKPAVSEDILFAALHNTDGDGTAIIQALLTHNADEIQVTQNVLIAAAARHGHHSKLISILMAHHGKAADIVHDMIVDAARWTQGPSLEEVFLTAGGSV
ncbi:hypothetical protein BDV19DRAFT_394075 [Aspergillus venezuelensis]